jgi:hypothetical protein
MLPGHQFGGAASPQQLASWPPNTVPINSGRSSRFTDWLNRNGRLSHACRVELW